jgi:ribonuclease HI
MSEVIGDLPHSIYCDGGCVSRNPSPHGGTWCFCWVTQKGERVRHQSGLVFPQEVGLGRITNNLTELLAAVKALESVSKNWDGTLYTDSLVTMRRITTGQRFVGIPNHLRLRALELRRGRKYKVVLVGGHPTRKELTEGRRERNGLPVSPHNQFCDHECCRLAKDFLSARGKR